MTEVEAKKPATDAGADDRRSRLPDGKSAFEALDATNLGVIVLNRRGQLVFANEPATGLLRSGETLQEREGELRAASPSAQSTLRAAITGAIGSVEASGVRTGNVFMLPRTGRLPIVIAAAPLMTSAALDAGGILLVYDTEAPVPLSRMLLHRVLGLTEAESALCVALLEGYSVREFAERRGVSYNTARTLLSRTFVKAGKARQSELVRMLGALSSNRSAPALPRGLPQVSSASTRFVGKRRTSSSVRYCGPTCNDFPTLRSACRSANTRPAERTSGTRMPMALRSSTCCRVR